MSGWTIDVEEGIRWIQSRVRVHDGSGGSSLDEAGVPMQLTPLQLHAVRTMPSFRLAGGWDVSCKPRQARFTTLCLAWAAYLLDACPGIGIAFLAPDETIREVRDVKFDIILESLWASGAYPAKRRKNANNLVLENGSRIAWAECGATVQAASRASLGGTIHWAIFSELAKWPAGEVTARNVVPTTKHSGENITVDSTPPENLGQGEYYLSVARQALEGTAPNKRFHFWPWWVEPSYRAREKARGQLTAEEAALVADHGLDRYQLQWRRQTMASPEVGGDLFFYIYPETAERALRPKSEGAFSEARIAELLDRTTRGDFPTPYGGDGRPWPPGARRQGTALPPPRWGETLPVKGPGGYFRCWSLPEPEPTTEQGGRRHARGFFVASQTRAPRHILGVDGAEGLPHGDFQAVYGLTTRGEHACTLRGRWEPLVFAGHLQRIATWYDHAHIELERAAIGPTVYRYLTEAIPLAELASKGADPILVERYPAELIRLRATNAATKAARFAAAMSALSGSLEVLDPDLVREMTLIDPRTGKCREGVGHHDDYFDACGLAFDARLTAIYGTAKKKTRRTVRYGVRGG